MYISAWEKKNEKKKKKTFLPKVPYNLKVYLCFLFYNKYPLVIVSYHLKTEDCKFSPWIPEICLSFWICAKALVVFLNLKVNILMATKWQKNLMCAVIQHKNYLTEQLIKHINFCCLKMSEVFENVFEEQCMIECIGEYHRSSCLVLYYYRI